MPSLKFSIYEGSLTPGYISYLIKRKKAKVHLSISKGRAVAVITYNNKDLWNFRPSVQGYETMKWKFWRFQKTYPKDTLPPMRIARDLLPGKYLQAQCNDLHEETQILSNHPSGLSTGSRLAGHEDQAEDIIESLRRSQIKLDEIAYRYGQPHRSSRHVPFLVTHVPAVLAGEAERKPGLPGEGAQGEHSFMQVSCEMIRVTEDQDISCGGTAIGVTTDGVRVCFKCGQQMRSEGFLVIPLRPRARELLFPFALLKDRFRFHYPEEPRFDIELTVEKIAGYQPNDLVTFSDGTECKQHVIGTLERI